MAPTDEVATAGTHQLKRVKMQPIRERGAEAGPFVAGFLAPAVEFHVLAIDIKTRSGVPTHMTDAEGDFAGVDRFTRNAKRGYDAVNVRIGRFPESRMC